MNREMRSAERTILCPVCGGRVVITHSDRVNRCEYCASPVLGKSQSRDCVNHPGRLAKGICSVCGDLVCEECMEQRVGDYGGKLLTIVNCTRSSCKEKSSWARPLNIQYLRLTDMRWADRIDGLILRATGLGGLLFMIFEMFFVLAMLYIQYFTEWGQVPGNIAYLFIPGDLIIMLGILGNLMAALLLQTALQTYIHEQQMSSGLLLLVLLITEAVFLVIRGLVFNLPGYPDPRVLQTLLISFGAATLMVFVGAIAAMAVGYKKRLQFSSAMRQLGLSAA